MDVLSRDSVPDDGFRLEPWFSRSEYESRLARIQSEVKVRGLDGVLAFQPESVTWLTGFFTRGYTSFQFALIPASGEPGVCCRDVENYYLERTGVFNLKALWNDSQDPLLEGAAFIRRVFGRRARIGVEKSAWQLNARRFEAIASALSDYDLVDASDLLIGARLVKSEAEIAFQRKAAGAAEAGMRAGMQAAVNQASERDIAAEVCAAMIKAGSDLPGPGVLSSGERALYLHGGYTDRVLRIGDLVQLECCPCVRFYHARFMRPIMVAQATKAHRKFSRDIIELQNEALAMVRPGVAASQPDSFIRNSILHRGLADKYTNKTFYSVGLMFPPSGGEPLEAAPGSAWHFKEGMVFHTYVLVRGFGFSETIAVNRSGIERLTNFPRELLVS